MCKTYCEIREPNRCAPAKKIEARGWQRIIKQKNVFSLWLWCIIITTQVLCSILSPSSLLALWHKKSFFLRHYGIRWHMITEWRAATTIVVADSEILNNKSLKGKTSMCVCTVDVCILLANIIPWYIMHQGKKETSKSHENTMSLTDFLVTFSTLIDAY